MTVLSPPAIRSATAARTRLAEVPEVRWATAATGLFLFGLAAQLSPIPGWIHWSFYLACYATGGWQPALEGLRAMRARTLDVDLLMIVAALGAAAIGQIFDGALLIVIFATSGALEAVLTRRTSDSIKSLLDLAPETAIMIVDDGERIVDAASLRPGDRVHVRPGDRIAGEGTVVSGASEVDQASITGELIPEFKRAGDEVFAGTVNGTGTLEVRIDVDPSETVIARITRLVEHASATKAKRQLFVDKVEQYYSKAVVASTAIVLGIPVLMGVEFRQALLRAMTFMIVASPCAVVLATMPPLLAAMATAGRNGVLVKSATVMEQLRITSVVAFDKTGTLTEGKPRVESIEPLVDDVVPNDILRLAAAVERGSEHPVAGAIVRASLDRTLSIPSASEFDSTPGSGVRGMVNGLAVSVTKPGNVSCGVVADFESRGMTAILVVVDGREVGVIGLVDTVREGVAAAVDDLDTLTGRGPVLVSGDNSLAAQAVARSVGIDDVRAGLLPHEKADVVRAMDGHVMFVGDGVNDAPALAAADIGVAMGRKGSDLTVDTADAVLVRDDLGAIASMIELSRRAHRIVVANLVIAATFIVVLVTWDLVGTLPLPVGVAGHESSTVLVALNGMRLLSSHAWKS